MKKIIPIVKYIAENNHWSSFPKQFFRALCYQIQKRFTTHVRVKRLFNGSHLYLFRNNPIVSAFMYTDIPDKAEINALRHLATSDTVFLDIGANIGAYSLMLKDKVKAVYAFEAHPETASLCEKNFALNEMNTEHVLHYAVSDNDTPKRFSNLGAGHPANSRLDSMGDSIEVPALTLDAFVKEKGFNKTTPLLLKIDVEGFEHEVFAGAKTLLAHYNVRGIIFENFSSYQEDIINMLHAQGFTTALISKHNTIAKRD